MVCISWKLLSNVTRIVTDNYELSSYFHQGLSGTNGINGDSGPPGPKVSLVFVI